MVHLRPRIHEYLQELHREVIAGRDSGLITVGEMPDVTVDDAVLFTDPSRNEVDMVFRVRAGAIEQAGQAPHGGSR